MKYLWLALLVLLPCLGLFAQKSMVEVQAQIAACEAKSFSGKMDFVSSAQTDDYNLFYHKMNWFLNPDSLYIRGLVSSSFEALAANFTLLHFDLNSALTVDSVTHNNSTLVFTHVSNLLTITLPSALAKNQADSVTIYYHGVPYGSGFGSFKQTTHAGVPMLWTLSEPYGSKDWWPCKQSLSDKIDSIDVYVSCPAGNKVAGNGVLQDTFSSGGTTRFHWKHRYPIATYLVGIAVANYAAYNDTVIMGNDTLMVLNYVFPETLADTRLATKDVVGVMQLYYQLFGKYPFIKEKYGHAQFGWGGGMEHQTMSFMGAFNHDLLAHELAHQWFGDKVTCASWSELWLNEGFATYLTGLTFEKLFDGYYWPIWKNNQLKAITEYDYGSVYIPDTITNTRLFDARLTYAKAAYVLHMMRWVVGDSAFFKGVRNYLADPACAYGFASTSLFVSHIKNASGKDLDGFMDDWYRGEGFPSYTVEWSQGPDNKVLVTLNQKQSHASVPFYEMPVPILLTGASEDTLLVLDHTFSGESFVANPGFKVDSVFFDPELHILSARNAVYNILDSLSDEIHVYPNPGQKEMVLSGGLLSNPLTHVFIVNMSGQTVKETQVEGYVPRTGIRINMEQLKPGMYTIRIVRKKNELVKKWCKT